MSSIFQTLKSGYEYVASRPALNQTFRLLILAGGLYAIYRFLMSRHAIAIRRKIPILSLLQARRQVRDLLRAGEHAKAGERLVQVGELDEAIRVYQEGNLFGRAADVYLKQRNPDRAALMYERAGDYAKAAELYLERKQYDRAEMSMEKLGKLDELGNLYLARGELSLAAAAFLRSNRFLEAGNAWAKLGKTAEAADAYRKAYAAAKSNSGGIASEIPSPEVERVALQAAAFLENLKDFQNAALIYLEIRKPKDAARCYGAGGNHKRAAELSEQIGDLDAASKHWGMSGDPKTAARVEGEKLFQAGQAQEAIAKFQEAADFTRAADIYLELHEPMKAAAMYERGSDPSLAAPLYRDAGKFEEAGAAFEKAKEYREAAACYRNAELWDREAALLEKIGDYFGLAEALERQGHEEKALRFLEQIGKQDSNYRKALSMKGKILLDRGETLAAKECLDKVVGTAERMTNEDVDAVYNLAVLSEQTQTESKALEVLERALIENHVEKDAVEKAQNVRKVLAEKAAVSRLSRVAPLSTFAAGAKGGPNQEATAVKNQRYLPIQEIGRGGMGIVYTARDTTLDRTVALKILPESLQTNERAVATFLREAKAAAALNHPNIVIVHDTGVQNGQYYIAMEYIDGRTIKEILKKRKKLVYASVLEVTRQLLSGLAYAHSKNVVHRDLTTNNIMWTQQKILKIMDFGLAKVITELMSEQSIVGGTPSFMSPEQTLGKPIDHRTDIYSFGICLYEMLLGELPFIGGDLGYHHLHTPPPNPLEKDPGMPQEFSLIILRCMQKDPAQRFQSVAEIRDIVGKMS